MGRADSCARGGPETGTIASYVAVAGEPSASDAELRGLGSTLVHSVGGSLVLLVVLFLNVYKPPGLTACGWRKQKEERGAARSGARRRPRSTAPEAIDWAVPPEAGSSGTMG